jgi:hypothetical protein
MRYAKREGSRQYWKPSPVRKREARPGTGGGEGRTGAPALGGSARVATWLLAEGSHSVTDVVPPSAMSDPSAQNAAACSASPLKPPTAAHRHVAATPFAAARAHTYMCVIPSTLNMHTTRLN